MGLAERLAAGMPVRQPRFEYVLEQLLPAEREALLAAVLNPAWSDRELVRVLNDEGIMVGIEAFTAWRAVVRSTTDFPEPVPLPPDFVPPTRGGLLQ